MCKKSPAKREKKQNKSGRERANDKRLSFSGRFAEPHSLWTKLKKGFDISLVRFFLFSFYFRVYAVNGTASAATIFLSAVFIYPIKR